MADETRSVVTELTIDARGAEVGSATYVRAMKAAQAATDKVIEREQAATAAIARQSAVMTGSVGSITSASRAWERLLATVDPAARSTQAMERALLVADTAARKLGVSEAEVERVLGKVRLQHDAVARAAEAQAQSYRELAAAGREAAAADHAQAGINRTLGIGAADVNSARASAAVFEAAGREADQMAAKVSVLRAELDPLATAQQHLNTELEEYAVLAARGAISTQELAAAQGLARARFDVTAASLARGSKLASFELRNLQFQMIDIAQSIPLAFQSPLYFMQNLGFQFAQIGQIFMGRGGLRAGLAETGSMIGGIVSRLASFLAGSTALRTLGTAAGFAAAGFGAIRDQASEAEHRVVGIGETIKAVFQVIGDAVRNSVLGSGIDAVTSGVGYAFQKLGSAAVDIAEMIINAFHAAYYDIVAGWKAFPDEIGALFVGAANAGIAAMNVLVKGVSDAVDYILAAFNRLPGADIPLLNASDQTIAPLDNQYLENLKKAVTDRNAAIEQIMQSTPLRDFASDVVDKISTNHALEGLEALGSVSFDKSIGGANALGSSIGGVGKAANGVTVEFGGMGQEVINITRLFEDAKRSQLIQLQQATQQLQSMKNQAEDIQKTLDAASQTPVDKVFGDSFTGNAEAAAAAIDRTVTSLDRMFSAMDTGNMSVRTFQESSDLLREALKQIGGDPRAVDAFINQIINGQLKVRELKSGVDSLSSSIRNIPNKTVTVTVVTKQVGSGTQSLYNVPSSSGGSSTVGVTRYGAAPGSQSGPSITSNSVPRTGGYGSMGGSGDLGSATVNVTRFATGGVIHPGDSQRVQFFKSPEETVGIFTPKQMGALADPQSAFTGREATREQDRLWTVLMNIEANTRKTYEGVEKLATTSSYGGGGSSGGGSSYGGGGGQGDELAQQYARVLAQVKANFRAAGVVGAGTIGYGGQGLAATPQQIARNIVYGGMSQLGSAGANDYERTLAQTEAMHAYVEAQRYQQQYGGGGGGSTPVPSAYEATRPATDAEWARLTPAMRERIYNRTDNTDWHKELYGFATGGIMGPGNGDTQKVEFFKNPNERVIVATPDQFEDRRGGSAKSDGGGQPITIYFSQTVRSDGAPPSKDSLAAQRRNTANGIEDALRSRLGR
ncbi:MAG: hypothetical protein EOR12_27070 [Mesorhizobium sp.]|uniref:hypothetical protein n=1 Tax=Mesorhizobium sp. TaxID=1871066 RepID=UPI000FE81795|nr:hypothetical protein [Mesorhizobium sp.]RWP84896.1 MAG: hypothetical protein EOR12_27070 [Mesorhizobium sp.]